MDKLKDDYNKAQENLVEEFDLKNILNKLALSH